jgi:hypothetical protein
VILPDTLGPHSFVDLGVNPDNLNVHHFLAKLPDLFNTTGRALFEGNLKRRNSPNKTIITF